jgi:hypothetical protein
LDRVSKLNGPSLADRRKWRRYDVNWPFQIEGVDRDRHVFWADGTLHDISARGSSGYCLDPPETGTRVVVSIKIPFKGDSWIRYLAEIVRLEDSPKGTLVALKFVSNRPVFYTQESRNKSAVRLSDDNLAKFNSNVIARA